MLCWNKIRYFILWQLLICSSTLRFQGYPVTPVLDMCNCRPSPRIFSHDFPREGLGSIRRKLLTFRLQNGKYLISIAARTVQTFRPAAGRTSGQTIGAQFVNVANVQYSNSIALEVRSVARPAAGRTTLFERHFLWSARYFLLSAHSSWLSDPYLKVY